MTITPTPASYWPHGATEEACSSCGLTMGESRLLADLKRGEVTIAAQESAPSSNTPEQEIARISREIEHQLANLNDFSIIDPETLALAEKVVAALARRATAGTTAPDELIRLAEFVSANSMSCGGCTNGVTCLGCGVKFTRDDDQHALGCIVQRAEEITAGNAAPTETDDCGAEIWEKQAANLRADLKTLQSFVDDLAMDESDKRAFYNVRGTVITYLHTSRDFASNIATAAPGDLPCTACGRQVRDHAATDWPACIASNAGAAPK